MKSILMTAFLISVLSIRLLSPSFSQKMSKQDYFELSRKQKTAGWILLSGGATLAVVGSAVMYENFCVFSCSDAIESSFNAGAAMAIIGSLSMVASVPIFVSSRNNGKKAAYLSFRNQPLDIPRYTNQPPKSYPVISLSIPLY